jgi:hypothetical protein
MKKTMIKLLVVSAVFSAGMCLFALKPQHNQASQWFADSYGICPGQFNMGYSQAEIDYLRSIQGC